MAESPQCLLEFSRLALAHIPFVMHIENEAYPEPWTYNMFRQELENEYSYFCVVLSEGAIVGYGGFWLIADEAHITRVTVVSALRGKGLSRKLMEHLFEVALDRGALVARLEVRESNAPALRLYENLGFVREGRRRAYYHTSNEDAIVMARKIKADMV